MKSDKWLLVTIGFLAGIVIGFVLGKLASGGGQTASNQPPPPQVNAQAVANREAEIKQLKELLSKDPANYQALVALGNAYFDSDQPGPSADAYNKALAIDGSSPDVRTDLGIMYRALGKYQEAIAEFRKAISLDPKHQNSRMNLGVVYLYDLKDYRSGLDAWKGYLALNPTGPRADQIRSQVTGLESMVSQVEKGESSGVDLQAPGTFKNLPPPPQ
jgi:cytochrome c-type biogenesis protein CcmH/NrfG